MATAIERVLEDGKLGFINLKKMTIKRCILRNLSIKNSKIFDSMLFDCTLSNCDARDCTFTRSTLHEVVTKGEKLIECQRTSAHLALRGFPPEIRAIIFGFYFEKRFTATPPLLIALRGDQQIYLEAIEVCYMQCQFRLSWRTMMKSGEMSEKAVTGIRNLYISDRKFSLPIAIPTFLLPATNLTHLYFTNKYSFSASSSIADMISPEWRQRKKIMAWVPLYINHFTNIQRLEARLTTFHENTFAFASAMFECPVVQFNKHLGIKGKMVTVGILLGQGSMVEDVWFWEAEKGESLKWTDRVRKVKKERSLDDLILFSP